MVRTEWPDGRDQYSYAGVLTALEAGTFWGDHDRIIDQLHLNAEPDGIDNPVHPGEVVDVQSRDKAALLS